MDNDEAPPSPKKIARRARRSEAARLNDALAEAILANPLYQGITRHQLNKILGHTYRGKGFTEALKQMVAKEGPELIRCVPEMPELKYKLSVRGLNRKMDAELSLCGLRALYEEFKREEWDTKEPLMASWGKKFFIERWHAHLFTCGLIKSSTLEGLLVDEILDIGEHYKTAVIIYIIVDGHFISCGENHFSKTHPGEKKAQLAIYEEHYCNFRWCPIIDFGRDVLTFSKKDANLWYKGRRLQHACLHELNDHEIVYFDFETHAVQVEGANVHRPYHVCALHTIHNEQTQYEYDLGSVVAGEVVSDVRSVFCSKLINIANMRIQNLKQLIMSKHYHEQAVFREPLYLCAYNASGFDMQFFIQWFAMNGFSRGDYDTKMTLKGSRVVLFSIYISGKSIGSKMQWIPFIQMHDMYLILNQSLDDAHKSFCSTAAKHKDLFPHLYYRNHGVSHIDCIGKTLKVELEDLPEKGRTGLSDEDKALMENFPYSQQLSTYCWQDVFMLRDLYVSFNATFEKVAIENKWMDPGANFCILDYPTGNNLAQNVAINSLDAKYVWNERFTNTKTKIYTRFRLPDTDADSFIRGATLGGMVYPRMQFYRSGRENVVSPYNPETEANYDEFVRKQVEQYDEQKDYLICVDFRAQYGSVLGYGVFPYGDHRKMTDEECNLVERAYKLINTVQGIQHAIPPCILQVDIEGSPFNLQPVSGYHVMSGSTQRLIWDNLRHECIYSSILVETILTDPMATLHGIKAGYIFQHQGDVFSHVAKTCLFEKQKAKEAHNPGQEGVYKFLVNSLFGGCMKRDFTSTSKLIMDKQSGETFLKRNKFTSSCDMAADGYMCELWTGEKIQDQDDNWHSGVPSYVGVFVLDQAKWQLSTLINFVSTPPEEVQQALRTKQNIDKVLRETAQYGDTDCFTAHASRNFMHTTIYAERNDPFEIALRNKVCLEQ